MAGKKTLSGPSYLFDYKIFDDGEAKKDGILVTVEGYLTFTDKRNRNDRFYPKGFWKAVLEGNAFVEELLETKTFFGETRHPSGKQPVLPEFSQISHSIRSFKIDEVGVYGVIDILDTPLGRILATLIKYGSKLGVSTRAYGEQEDDGSGNMVPKIDTYIFVTWDFVVFPAFSESRMNEEGVSDAWGVTAKEMAPLVDQKTFIKDLRVSSEKEAHFVMELVGLNDSLTIENPAQSKEIEGYKTQIEELNKTNISLEKQLKESLNDDVITAYLKKMGKKAVDASDSIVVTVKDQEIFKAKEEFKKIEVELKDKVAKAEKAFNDSLLNMNSLSSAKQISDDRIIELEKRIKEIPTLETQIIEMGDMMAEKSKTIRELTAGKAINDGLVISLNAELKELKDKYNLLVGKFNGLKANHDQLVINYENNVTAYNIVKGKVDKLTDSVEIQPRKKPNSDKKQYSNRRRPMIGPAGEGKMKNTSQEDIQPVNDEAEELDSFSQTLKKL